MTDHELLHYRLRVMTNDLETVVKDQSLSASVRLHLQSALLDVMKANIELLKGGEPCEQRS